MIKKIVLAAFVLGALSVTSCKQKGEEVSKTDPNLAAPAMQKELGAVQNTTAPEKPADGKYPTMAFESTEHDFGNINAKDVVEHVFKFKNTGEADLIITNAVGTCGCTVPEFPKNPLKPGESGDIKVSFNPSGKNGQQTKTVNISTNTANVTEHLTIKASIQGETKTK